MKPANLKGGLASNKNLTLGNLPLSLACEAKTPKPKPTAKVSRASLSASSPNGQPKQSKPLVKRRLFALDTETTGLDLRHGCRPFFVSVMDEQGSLRFWEWDVNPYTRNVGCYVNGASLTTKNGRGYSSPPKKGCKTLNYPLDLLEESPYGKHTFLKILPQNDIEELSKLLLENDFVLHNTRFDARALELAGFPRMALHTVHDTLIASHCLVSNESHKLKDLSLQYLDINDDDQKALRDAVNEARRIGRSLDWAIAEDGGHPHFPAQKKAPKDGWWVYDMWLPRAVAKYRWEVEGDPHFAPAGSEDSGGVNSDGSPIEVGYDSHPWWTVLRTYALRDVERTYPLWLLQEEALKKEHLWSVYLERRKLLESTYELESSGVTISLTRLKELTTKLQTESQNMAVKCYKIAKAANPKIKELNLNSPKQLTGILYGNLGVKPVKLTTAGINNVKARVERQPTDYSTAADALQTVLERLHESYPKPYLPPKKRQAAYDFVWNLLGYRAREKSLDYLEEYHVRSIPLSIAGCGTTAIPRASKSKSAKVRKVLQPEFAAIYPSFNPTGSDTLRFSSSNPNAQNIGKGNKRKDDPVPSLRSVFGPAPGREWYSIDYSNIELRIFAYQSGDQSLIDAYEQGFAVHCIFAKLLFEKEYKECEREVEAKLSKDLKSCDSKAAAAGMVRKLTEKLFKDKYETNLYQWTKNGNFGLIYGAGRAKADATYHRPGAYDLIRERMPMIDEFMDSKNREAKRYGYITTLGGYRLWVPASEPHVAVNYFVQGSAGWCMVLAINRVHSYLSQLNDELRQSGELVDRDRGYQMIMTIHDELDFDFPKHERNHRVISDIACLMEQSGRDIGVPTPVEVECHPDNWSVGEKVNILL